MQRPLLFCTSTPPKCKSWEIVPQLCLNVQLQKKPVKRKQTVARWCVVVASEPTTSRLLQDHTPHSQLALLTSLFIYIHRANQAYSQLDSTLNHSVLMWCYNHFKISGETTLCNSVCHCLNFRHLTNYTFSVTEVRK